MADSFIVSLPSRLFICIRVNRKKYKSCYDDVLESLQGCRRFKEKMYKNWMNGVKMRANDVRHYFFGIIIKKIAMPEYEYRYLEKRD